MIQRLRLAIFLLFAFALTGCMELAYTAYVMAAGTAMTLDVCALPVREIEAANHNAPRRYRITITDDRGEPVRAAQLTIQYEKKVARPYGSDTVSLFTTRTIDSGNEIEIPGEITALDLRRDGFYPQTYIKHGSTYQLTRENNHQLDTHYQTNARSPTFPLTATLPITTLDYRRDVITMNADGSGIVITPEHPVADWRAATLITDITKAPSHHLYVTASRDENGIIVDGPAKGCDPPRPRSVTFGITGEGNGLQLYRSQSPNDVYMAMRQAPTTGYSQQITLDADTLTQLMDKKPVYFFVKCNNKYGRAVAIRWCMQEFEAGKYQRYGLRLELTMQPDGTTNLDELRPP